MPAPTSLKEFLGSQCGFSVRVTVLGGLFSLIEGTVLHLSHHCSSLLPQGNTGDHQYEEIHVRRQQESSLPSVCAVTSPPPDLVYHANVDFQKDTSVNLPTDIVHYATVDFQKDGRMLPVTSENSSTPMGQDVINPSADIVPYTTVGFHTDGKTLPDTKKNSSAGTGHSATSNQAPETTLYSTVIRQGEQ